jgi:hypothetical protein
MLLTMVRRLLDYLLGYSRHGRCSHYFYIWMLKMESNTLLQLHWSLGVVFQCLDSMLWFFDIATTSLLN